jgi:hypothetical protein
MRCSLLGLDANRFLCTELRIHEYTERGDNNSIKLANKNVKVDGVKCCSER